MQLSLSCPLMDGFSGGNPLFRSCPCSLRCRTSGRRLPAPSTSPLCEKLLACPCSHSAWLSFPSVYPPSVSFLKVLRLESASLLAPPSGPTRYGANPRQAAWRRDQHWCEAWEFPPVSSSLIARAKDRRTRPLASRGDERRSEDFHRAFQGLPYTPGERDADEGPEQRGLGVEPASVDAERTGLHRRALRTRRLQFGDLFSAHIPFGVNRLDQEVADQSGDQHGAQNVHRCVVELVTRNACLKLELADVVHHHRTDDAGGRPRRQQPAVNSAHKLRSEHVGEIGRHRGEAAAIHRQDDSERPDEKQFRAHRCEGRCQCIERNAQNEECVIGVLAADIV